MLKWIFKKLLKSSFFILIQIILSANIVLASNSSSKKYPYEAYLDLEEGEVVQAFSQPGLSWSTCTAAKNNNGSVYCKEAQGWPNKNAKITVLEKPVTMNVEDPVTEDLMPKDYVKIKFEYEVNVNGKVITKTGEGYIEKGRVRDYGKNHEKLKSFYSKSESSKENCPDRTKNTSVVDKKNLETAKQLAQSAHSLSVIDAADLIHSKIGHCANMSTQSGIPYDTAILPKMVSLNKSEIPKILKEDGTPLSLTDLIDIDALARTMYGEIRGCFSQGLHYPMAQAKIAVNRVEKLKGYPYFIQGNHSNAKGSLAKVLTTGTQFNVWKTSDKALPSILCPPSNSSVKLPNGRKPTPEQISIWKDAVKVATEAVISPNKFKERTKEVTQVFATAHFENYNGYKQVFPNILGRSVDNNHCLQIWEDKKVSKK